MLRWLLSADCSLPLGIIFIDAQLVCDLAVVQIQPHQVQPRDPHPQRLMVARKHSAREIVESLFIPQTAVSLSGSLMLVPALFRDLVRVTVGTPHSLRPAVSLNDTELNKTQGVLASGAGRRP